MTPLPLLICGGLIAAGVSLFLLAWAYCRAAAGRLVVHEDVGEYGDE